jgi:DivIVA domain-containing protein
MWFWVVVLVLVVGAIAVFAAGRDNAMAEVYDDRPDRTIPTGRPLTSEDLQEVRFSSALRGYRMDEVDALIDRIAADLMSREQHARPEAAGEPERHQHEEPIASEASADSAASPAPTSHRATATTDEAEQTAQQDPVHPARSDDDAPRDATR